MKKYNKKDLNLFFQLKLKKSVHKDHGKSIGTGFAMVFFVYNCSFHAPPTLKGFLKTFSKVKVCLTFDL